jgi:hypothetical protein
MDDETEPPQMRKGAMVGSGEPEVIKMRKNQSSIQPKPQNKHKQSHHNR